MNIEARNGSFNDDGTIDVRVNIYGEGDVELTCGELHIDTTLGPLDIDSMMAFDQPALQLEATKGGDDGQSE